MDLPHADGEGRAKVRGVRRCDPANWAELYCPLAAYCAECLDCWKDGVEAGMSGARAERFVGRPSATY